MPLSAAVRRDCRFLHQLTASQQSNRDGFRQHAFLVSQQLPRLLPLDFHLYPVLFKGVGHHDFHRLTRQGCAGAVCYCLTISLGIVVVLPDFPISSCRHFKFLCFARSQGKGGFLSLHQQGKAVFSVPVGFGVFSCQHFRDADYGGLPRLIWFLRHPVLEAHRNGFASCDAPFGFAVHRKIPLGIAFPHGVSHTVWQSLKHGLLTCFQSQFSSAG